jgi:hypothetical protein
LEIRKGRLQEEGENNVVKSCNICFLSPNTGHEGSAKGLSALAPTRARTHYSYTYSFVHPNTRIIEAERIAKVVLVRRGTIFFSKRNNTVKNNFDLF